MKKIIIAIIPFLFVISGISQQVYLLDLAKSIEIAKKQSFRMLILKKELEQSEYQLQAATRKFRTKVNFDLDGPEYSQTIDQWKDSTGIHFFQTNQFMYEGAFTINQPLPTDGNLYISSGIYNYNDYNEDENSFKLGTSINFTQPIEALYAYNRIRSEFKRAKLDYESTLKSLKRTELELIYETSYSFYTLLSTKQRKEIAFQTLSRQKDAYEIAKNKYEAGLIREVEALQIEVDLGQAQNNYDLAISNYESQANSFKQTLGLSLKDSIVLESEMKYNIITVDINKAVQHGLDNRLEIREREISIELTQLELKQQKSEGMISGNIIAHYGLSGVNKHSIPVGLSESFSTTYRTMINNPDDYSFGIYLSIPIIDWGENRARVKSIKANLDMNEYRLEEEKVTIEREIRNTVSQLNSALRRLQLLEKNVSLAEKSFIISEYRFQNGDIDSEAFALDRERLNNTKLSHLEAYISYKLLIADLMRKTFYDFENDQPVI